MSQNTPPKPPTATFGSRVGESFKLDTVLVAETLLVTTAFGSAIPAMVLHLRAQLLGKLDGKKFDWVIDLLGIEKFHRETNSAFIDVLKTFKLQGGNRIVVVSQDAHRMLLSTIGLSSSAEGGPSVNIESTLAAAFSRLGRNPITGGLR